MFGSVPSITLLASAAPASLALSLLITLAAAALVATLAKRVKLNEIPAYLIAGVLIGPHLLALIKDPGDVREISNLAVVLLLFTLGLSLDTASIGRGLVHILAIGVVSMAACTLAGWGIALAFGAPAPAALAISLALALSSTAVLVRILQSRRELRASHARVSLGVSIVQDMASVAVLALIPPIAKWAGHDVPGLASSLFPMPRGMESLPAIAQLLFRACVGLGGIVAIMLLARWTLPRLLREVAKVGSGELLMVVAAAIALAGAIGTSLLGFSSEMGAFLAGFMLASTPYRYQLTGQLAPVRDLLMALFFTTVGLGVDPGVLLDSWWVVLFGLVLLLALKGGLIALTAWLGGMSAPGALLVGVYLASAGEFSLVVLAAALDAKILGPQGYAQVVLIVTASLVVTPLLVGPAHRWGQRVARVRLAGLFAGAALADAHEPHRPHPHHEHAPAGIDPTRHVVIAGFGPVGRALADRFDKLGVSYTVIELNPRTVIRQSGAGKSVVYGDVSNPDVLEQAGIREAQAVCLTVPDDDAVMRACTAIRRLAPEVFIAARTNFLSQGIRAQRLGADHVTVEEIATAQAMEKEVVAKLTRRHAAASTPSPAA